MNQISPQIDCKENQTDNYSQDADWHLPSLPISHKTNSKVFPLESHKNERETEKRENEISEESSDQNPVQDHQDISIHQSVPRVKKLKSEPTELSDKSSFLQASFLRDIWYSDFYSKYDIKYLTSEDDKKQYDISKIKVARYYLAVIEFTLIVNFVMNTHNSEQIEIFVTTPIDQVKFGCILLLLILLVMSYFSKIQYAILAFLPLQAIQLINLNYQKNIMALDDPHERNFEVLAGILMFQFGLFNTVVLNEVLAKWNYAHISCFVVINYISFFRRLFEGTGGFYVWIGFIAIITITFGTTMKLFKNLEQNLIVQISQKQVNFLSQYDNLKEFETLYQNLDLGILVTKNNQFDYANDLFQNFMEKTNGYDENFILDLKVFEFFKKTSQDDNKSQDPSAQQLFSLRELMKQTPDFLRQNVFKVIFENENEESTFKYIQLKVKSIITGNQKLIEGDQKEISMLIQLVDISDKILYTDVKAQHSFLEMINAAVSHELRNPLNSLIGQSCSMQEFFSSFRQIIAQMSISPLKSKLQKVHDGLEKCSQKMSSACKFIDFFVHDVLDYTILNKDSKNFIKNCSNFDLSTAILEINEILEDKSNLKNIKIEVQYKGFHSKNLKTDKKRLQQIILNLMSNALKFTARNGKILLLAEKIDDFLRISVIDSGVGIKKKHQGKIFSMFGSIKDENKKINVHGVGLGLMICKLIVNKFEGNIDFVSKYKKGSTFFFTFKLDPNDQIVEQKAEPDQTQPREVKIFDDSCSTSLQDLFLSLSLFKKYTHNRILVIDDEEFCISSMRVILFKLGLDISLQVDFCMIGQEAINLVESSIQQGMGYKLVLTDFNMPIMNGLEATKRLREIFGRQTVIVGVTGYASSNYHQIGEEAGMDTVISKPVYVPIMDKILDQYYR